MSDLFKRILILLNNNQRTQLNNISAVICDKSIEKKNVIFLIPPHI